MSRFKNLIAFNTLCIIFNSSLFYTFRQPAFYLPIGLSIIALIASFHGLFEEERKKRIAEGRAEL